MEVTERILCILQSHPLVLFMRGDPDRPMCEGSADVVSALNAVQADFTFVDVQKDPEVRAFLPKQSDWGGLPQIFVNGEFFGGAQVVCDLLSQGELEPIVSGLKPEFKRVG